MQVQALTLVLAAGEVAVLALVPHVWQLFVTVEGAVNVTVP
jgi:hypothetical protein